MIVVYKIFLWTDSCIWCLAPWDRFTSVPLDQGVLATSKLGYLITSWSIHGF